MQINISTRHGHLSEESQAKLKGKLEKLTRFFDRLMAIEMTVDLEHPESPEVEIRVSAEHKHDFMATERTAELMASVDGAIHKIEQQIKKHKQKIQDHHRGTGLRHQEISSETEPTGE